MLEETLGYAWQYNAMKANSIRKIAFQTSAEEVEQVNRVAYWINSYCEMYTNIEQTEQYVEEVREKVLTNTYTGKINPDNISAMRQSILKQVLICHEEMDNGIRS